MNYKVTAFDLKLALLQYFRFKRQWICVDEFQGADIIVDTGKEIIEVEVKVTKSDLINGERKKLRKHEGYKQGHRYYSFYPNKFLFCVPEELVDVALGWVTEINENYGVIGFDVNKLEKHINMGWGIWHCNNIRIAKSAKQLHENYNDKLRWAIAKRTSAKIASLMELHFTRTLEQLRKAKDDKKEVQQESI